MITPEESEPVVGPSMKLRTVTRALLTAAVDEDEELRARSSASLSRLGGAHPLTVLAEWLAVFTSARDPAARSGKKRQGGAERHLIAGLRPVLDQMTSADSLDGGDVRHRAVIGQIMSVLVEEMVAVKEVGDPRISMIQDLLVVMASQYMDKVMDVLLLHFQPNSSVKISETIFNSFGKLASSLPMQVVPFSKTIIDTCVLLSKQIKQSETELKMSLCDCLTRVIASVMQYIASNPDQTDNIVTREQFSVDADDLYETIFSAWLPQTKDAEARNTFLLFLSILTPLMSPDTVCNKGPGYLTSLTGLHKKSVGNYELSLCLYELLAVLSSSEVCLLVDTVIDPLLIVLFQQICIPLDLALTTSMKNQLEVLKCYDTLMKVTPEKIIHTMLGKLDLSDEKSRSGALTVISNSLNSPREVLGAKLKDISEKIFTRLNETNLKAKKTMLQIILQLNGHGEPDSIEKRIVFVEFIVKNCGTEDAENVGRESENILKSLTTTDQYQAVLWKYLILHLHTFNSVQSLSAVMSSLAVIARLKYEANDVTYSFGNLQSQVTPYRLFAKLIVVASDAQHKAQAIDILRFLQYFSCNINRHLVELWTKRIPLLVHFLDQNTDVDQVQWTNWLCEFTKDSVNQIGKCLFHKMLIFSQRKR